MVFLGKFKGQCHVHPLRTFLPNVGVKSEGYLSLRSNHPVVYV